MYFLSKCLNIHHGTFPTSRKHFERSTLPPKPFVKRIFSKFKFKSRPAKSKSIRSDSFVFLERTSQFTSGVRCLRQQNSKLRFRILSYFHFLTHDLQVTILQTLLFHSLIKRFSYSRPAGVIHLLCLLYLICWGYFYRGFKVINWKKTYEKRKLRFLVLWSLSKPQKIAYHWAKGSDHCLLRSRFETVKRYPNLFEEHYRSTTLKTSPNI